MQDGVVDVVCFFGVLHHTAGKEKTLLAYAQKVREGGKVMLAEAVDRPRATVGLLRRFWPDDEESEHEERMDVRPFRKTIHSLATNHRPGVYLEAYTPIYGMVLRLARLRRLVLSSRKRHERFLRFDGFVARTAGKVLPVMGPGMVLSVFTVQKQTVQR